MTEVIKEASLNLVSKRECSKFVC